MKYVLMAGVLALFSAVDASPLDELLPRPKEMRKGVE